MLFMCVSIARLFNSNRSRHNIMNPSAVKLTYHINDFTR